MLAWQGFLDGILWSVLSSASISCWANGLSLGRVSGYGFHRLQRQYVWLLLGDAHFL